MRETLNKTNDYLNGLKLREMPLFLLSCMFFGWNGIQFVFSLGLLLTFIDSKSMTRLVLTSLRYNTRAIPIYAFTLTTFFIIHWIIRCYSESSFSAKLQNIELKRAELWTITVNFFVPNLIIVLLIFGIIGTFYLASTFSQIIFGGFSSDMNIAVEYALYRWLYLSIISSIIVTILLIDIVLPKMIKHHSFKGSLYRAFVHIKKNVRQISLFYLLKTLLILFTIFIFQSILRHFVLPYFMLLEDKYSFSLLLMSGRSLSLRHILTNISIVYAMLTSALLIFAPIMAFPYVYQRLLLHKWTNY